MRHAILISGLILSLGSGAAAVPPDKQVRMEPGGDGFERGYQGDWTATSMEPEVVQARAFATREVHLTAGQAGSCLVLLHNQYLRQVLVWRVRVGEKPAAPDPGPVKKACGCDAGQRPLDCRLTSAACLDALRAYLADSDLTSAQLRLTYTVPGLQAKARHLDARIKAAGFAGIEVGLVGTNVRLRGRVADVQAWRRLVVLVFEGFVGRLILDDQLQVGGDPDGGTK